MWALRLFFATQAAIVGHGHGQSIHEIGCLMGKQTVAEFVENPAILDVVRGCGVHCAQGYAVGHPVPLDQVLLYLAPGHAEHFVN